MPATTLTQQAGPSPYSTLGRAVTMNASDASNGNDFLATSNQLVIFHNTNAGAQTVSITPKPLAVYGTLPGVVNVSLAAGEIRVFRLADAGWKDATSGKITIDTSHSDVKVGLVDLTQESFV